MTQDRRNVMQDSVTKPKEARWVMGQIKARAAPPVRGASRTMHGREGMANTTLRAVDADGGCRSDPVLRLPSRGLDDHRRCWVRRVPAHHPRHLECAAPR